MSGTVERIPAISVSEAFVKVYYRILHEEPASAYKFYQDNSQLSRQDDNGNMSITTSLEAINEKIQSMNCNLLRVNVRWVDAQDSIGGGVKVTVTGFMVGMDNSSRDFVQVFFLAPIETGYFVLNDMLRFFDQDSRSAPRNDKIVAPTEINLDNVETMANEEEIPLVEVEVSKVKTEIDAMEVPFVNEAPNVETVVDTEEVVPVEVVAEIPNVETRVDVEVVPLVEVLDEISNVDEESAPLDEVVDEVPNVETRVDTEEVPPAETVDEIPNVENVVDAEEVPLAELVEEVPNLETVVNSEMAPHLDAEVPLGNVVDEACDDSHVTQPNVVLLAKIAEELPDQPCIESESKMDEVPNKSYASTEIGETSSSHAVTSPGISHLQPSVSAAEEIPISAEADHDYSIYLKCLPMSVTPSVLENEFKRFGAIKSGGIQVKINKQGFCFGLLEFEEANSVQKALRASPVGIVGRQIVVEEKHCSNPRVGRGAHRFRHDRTMVGVGGGMHCHFPMRGIGLGSGGRRMGGRMGGITKVESHSGARNSREILQQVNKH